MAVLFVAKVNKAQKWWENLNVYLSILTDITAQNASVMALIIKATKVLLVAVPM